MSGEPNPLWASLLKGVAGESQDITALSSSILGAKVCVSTSWVPWDCDIPPQD